MDMYLRKRQTLLDRIRETIGLTGIYTRGVAFWMVPEELDAACYWKGKQVCSIVNSDEFVKSINDIIESDFVKNIFLNILGDDDEYSLNITARGTSLFEKGTNFCPISYNSKGNNINIKRQQGIITPNYINDLFNIEFSCESINDYYKGIIDNYEEKQIDIIDAFDSNYSQLEIIEQPKKLILKPKINL